MMALDVTAAFIRPTYDAGVTRTTPAALEPEEGADSHASVRSIPFLIASVGDGWSAQPQTTPVRLHAWSDPLRGPNGNVVEASRSTSPLLKAHCGMTRATRCVNGSAAATAGRPATRNSIPITTFIIPSGRPLNRRASSQPPPEGLAGGHSSAKPPHTCRRATVAPCHVRTRATTSITSATATCPFSRSSVWWRRTTRSRSRTARHVAGTMGSPAVEWVLTSPVRTHTTITATSTRASLAALGGTPISRVTSRAGQHG